MLIEIERRKYEIFISQNVYRSAMSYTSEDFTLLGLSSENWILLIGAIVIVGIAALTAKL
jgi:hypothetical protein